MANTTTSEVLDFMQVTSGGTGVPSDAVITTFIAFADRIVNKNIVSVNTTDKQLLSNILTAHLVARNMANVSSSSTKSFAIGKIRIDRTDNMGWGVRANQYLVDFYDTAILIDGDVDLTKITEPSDYVGDTYDSTNVDNKHFGITKTRNPENIQHVGGAEKEYVAV